jgi:hypothetical protein
MKHTTLHATTTTPSTHHYRVLAEVGGMPAGMPYRVSARAGDIYHM